MVTEDNNEQESILKKLWNTLWGFFKWLAAACMVGVVVGSIGCLFYYSVTYALDIRARVSWLVFLLPFGGLLIVWMYHLANVPEPKGTDLIIESIQTDGTEPPAKMAPLIFISTTLTHLFGGSSGREGAALQMGGSLGNLLGNILQFDEKSKKILIMCGMSAAFTALFGTPLAATVFAMELISVGVMYYAALVPCVISSVVAFEMAKHFGIHSEAFQITGSPEIGIESVIKVLLLAMFCAGISVGLCFILHYAGKKYKRFFRDPYLRIFAGGIFVIVLVMIFHTQEYTGLGMATIKEAITEGVVDPEDFLLKMLFTAVTLGAGYKGGEIVPSFFIGATFGCFIGPLLGLSPSFAGAIGLITVFCGVTNCPMTALLLSFELFHYESPLLFLIAIAASYMLSGYYSLYSKQKILYDKLKPQFINRKSH